MSNRHKASLLGVCTQAMGRTDRAEILGRTCSVKFSSLAVLLASLRLWFHFSLLRSVLCQLRSCYYCILMTRRLCCALNFEKVRQSLPRVPCSDSHNEMQFCTASIQSLQAVRPYLTIADVELFLQGWFLSEQWFRHMGSESHSEQRAS